MLWFSMDFTQIPQIGTQFIFGNDYLRVENILTDNSDTVIYVAFSKISDISGIPDCDPSVPCLYLDGGVPSYDCNDIVTEAWQTQMLDDMAQTHAYTPKRNFPRMGRNKPRSLSEKLGLILAITGLNQETDLAHGTNYHTLTKQACSYCVMRSETKAILLLNWTMPCNNLHGEN